MEKVVFNAKGIRNMERCAIIIQGEGKGHFSQAMAALQLLEEHEIEITAVYLGKSLMRKTPSYIQKYKGLKLRTFLSPNFIRTPDRKGIFIAGSLFLNFLLIPLYLFETLRLARRIRREGCSLLLNFYDPLGSRAASWWMPKIRHITISHHFYLSHPDFIHPHGLERSYFWLQWMNHLMHKQTDMALALSFRKGKDERKIRVIPPLIGLDVKLIPYSQGERDLCYFLNHGYAREIIEFYRQHPEWQADIFAEGLNNLNVPGNVIVHEANREEFLAKMSRCRRIISSAGFDLVAEAFYLGIPIYLLPTSNHYEQYCNALDASRTGMAFQLENMADLEHIEFEPQGNKQFRTWAEKSKEYFINALGID